MAQKKKYKNIERLLGNPETPLHKELSVSEIQDGLYPFIKDRFPAYKQMLDRARRDYIDEKQAPEFEKRIALDDEETFSNKSESNPLIDILKNDPEISKEFLQTLNRRQLLEDRKNSPPDVDRSAINSQILRTYIRDIDPSLYKHIEMLENSKFTDYSPEERDLLERDNAENLMNKAKKMYKDKYLYDDFNYEPKDLRNDNYSGYFEPNSTNGKKDTIVVGTGERHNLNNLGYPLNTPFHELLHAVDKKASRSGNLERGVDMRKDENLDISIPMSQRGHILVPAKGTIIPTDQETASRWIDAPGESGVYFERLRNLVGRPVEKK